MNLNKLNNLVYTYKNKNGAGFIAFWIGVILLVTLILLTSSGGEKYNLSVKTKGDEYLYSGEYDKAIEQYSKIKTNKSKNVLDEALKSISIADAYALKGDIENYNSYLNLTKSFNVENEQILNKLMFHEFMKGNIEDSIKYGEKALKVNPQNKTSIKQMIALYMANDAIDKAKALVKVYPLDKNSAYDLAEYARILMIIGDKEQAFNQLKAAYKVDAEEFKIYDVLAQESLYNKEKTIKYIKELASKDSNELAYKMWLAKIYSLSATTSKEADNSIKELSNKNINNTEIQLIKVSILQNSNKFDEAENIIKQLLEKDKDDYRVLHAAGWLYLKKHDLNKAMEYAKKSIEQNKEYPDNYAFLMPQILQTMDKANVAESYYRTAMEKEPYNYNIILNAANYYWGTVQKPENALETYKLASKIYPNEPEIKYNIALLYFNEGKDKEAVQALKECIKLNDSSIKYHRTLGTIYLNMGISDEGMREIRTAFKYDGNDILTLNNAGCYYIIYTNDFNRGYYNLKSAVEGINNDTDEYTKRVIKENYSKVKTIIDKIEKGKGNESIKVPDFRLLY